jgi:hypothetical protein
MTTIMNIERPLVASILRSPKYLRSQVRSWTPSLTSTSQKISEMQGWKATLVFLVPVRLENSRSNEISISKRKLQRPLIKCPVEDDLLCPLRWEKPRAALPAGMGQNRYFYRNKHQSWQSQESSTATLSLTFSLKNLSRPLQVISVSWYHKILTFTKLTHKF